MAYGIKTRGRPNAKIKVRSISGLTPRGYEYHRMSRKHKTVMFKKIQ